MSSKIDIVTKRYKFKVELNNSKTSREILKILPVKSDVNRWGDEIYFSIPMEAELENGVEVLDIGAVAFWPHGNAFCIFFGRTPASTGEKPQAVSMVTVLGKIIGKKNLLNLKRIKSGEEIEIRLAKWELLY